MAACFGPCAPTIFEWIAYGALVMVAGILVGVAYVLARRVRAAGRASSTFVPIVVITTSIVLAAIVVPRYPRPTFVPALVSAGLDNSGETDQFYLEGSYTVSWTLQPASGSACHLEAGLYSASDRGLVAQLVAATTTASGEARGIDGLPGGGYFIKGASECRWRVTFTPDPASG